MVVVVVVEDTAVVVIVVADAVAVVAVVVVDVLVAIVVSLWEKDTVDFGQLMAYKCCDIRQNTDSHQASWVPAAVAVVVACCCNIADPDTRGEPQGHPLVHTSPVDREADRWWSATAV